MKKASRNSIKSIAVLFVLLVSTSTHAIPRDVEAARCDSLRSCSCEFLGIGCSYE